MYRKLRRLFTEQQSTLAQHATKLLEQQSTITQQAAKLREQQQLLQQMRDEIEIIREAVRPQNTYSFPAPYLPWGD